MTEINQFPQALICNHYYASQTEYRQHFENKEPVVMTRDEFDAAIQQCEADKQNYIIIYEHQLLKKLDMWDAYPDKVTLDELEFMYLMGFINQEVYLTHKANLISD